MFHIEGIIFIAVLCIVNAAFTVNIPENNIRNVEKCANKICDQQCRQMGFAVGKCVEFTCECNNFTKNVGDDVNADDENANVEKLSDCNPAACDQLCRRLKFPGGVCVNGRCKCDNFRGDLEIYVNNDLKTVDKNDIGELSDCNPAACDQLCRRLKFPGGVCVNGRCKCDNFLRELVMLPINYFDAADNDDIKALSDCNPAACDQLCRRLKFPGGVCVNGRCKCDNFRQDLEPIINHQIVAEISCVNAVCNQICRRLGFLKGECTGDRCECSNIFTQNGNRQKIFKEPVCDEKKCNIWCQKMHYLGGFCQLYKCECY